MTVGGMRWRLRLVVAGALAGVYLLGTSAVLFTHPDSTVAFWWPAAGVAVAMVALAPRSWWPALAAAVVVVSAAANVTGGRSWDVAVAFGVANAAEAVVAGLLLKRRSGRLIQLEELSDFVRLVAATVAGATVIGVGAALTLFLLDDREFLVVLRNVFTSHAAATLVIVPVVMTWRLRKGVAGTAEYAVQLTITAALTALVFVPADPYPLTFATLPLMVWAAMRLAPHTVALELLGICVAAILLTGQGRGPFSEVGVDTGISTALAAPLVQGYILCTTLVALPLTLAIAQRTRMLGLLAERERLFRRNFTESLTGMLLLARRGDRLEIIDANETARQLLDDGTEPTVGRYLDRVLSEPATVRDATQAMLEDGLDGWRGHVGLAHRPDSHVDVAISQLSTGEDATFAAQLLDVTPLHEALGRTQAAERLTSATLDTARCLILMTDLDGTVVRVNDATTVLTGYPEEQILGHPVWTTIVPDHRVDTVKEIFADPEVIPGTREADVTTVTGDRLRVVWSADLVRDEDGAPRYAVMTGVDVTAERTTAGLMANLFQAGISTAIIGIDSRGRITLINSGAESLLGFSSEALTDMPFVDLLDAAQLAERTAGYDGTGWAALTAMLAGRHESQLSDWTWVGAGGVRRTVAMTISGGGNGFGSRAGYLVVGRDVTEQRHSQMMLMAALDKERMAADRLRQLDTAKNDFVSTVSHELRTPVTSIVGYTEMLTDGSMVDPDPRQLPLLDTIARNGQRLIALCNDLLLLAGLDSGGAVWDRAAVDLCDIARHAEESMRPSLRDRELDVSFEVPDQPLGVLGDPIQLERVLLNLLSNAVKFTPDTGRVTTRLFCRDGEAWLVVEDTGIGIPREEQDELFVKFFRATTAHDLAIQGTGLGLSIVAGIVAAHGGRIGVESDAGKGTTITVRFPLHA
jgi:PAS domain S-box-containing protein